jgi:hypothetical protein
MRALLYARGDRSCNIIPGYVAGGYTRMPVALALLSLYLLAEFRKQLLGKLAVAVKLSK